MASKAQVAVQKLRDAADALEQLSPFIAGAGGFTLFPAALRAKADAIEQRVRELLDAVEGDITGDEPPTDVRRERVVIHDLRGEQT